MSEWKEGYFSDFIEINPLVKYDNKSEISFVEMKDLEDGIRYCVPKITRSITSGARFADRDTLFARITPCLENGKIAQVKSLKNGVGLGSTEFLVFRGKDNITDSDYVYYLARSEEVRAHAEKNLDGTSGRQRVPKSCFNELKVKIPPLPEQKAIAEVLSSLDDKIDLLHHQNATLEAMAETLFRQWFVEEAEDDWAEAPLSQIAYFLNGLACQKYPVINDQEKLPVLKIKELRNRGISPDTDWANSRIDKEYIVQSGDVVFSWSASLLVDFWVGETCILNQHLFKVTSDSYPKWFYFFWCKYHLADFIAISTSHATTMGHIKRGDLDSAMVKIPNPKYIDSFDNTFDPLIDKIIKTRSQINCLAIYRDYLIKELLTGDVRVIF